MASSIPENCMVATVNNLLRLTSDLNSWTSKLWLLTEINIDVSSAAQGALSSSPSGVYPHQNIPYPCIKYYFDENIFFGIDAKDLLVKMLKSPNCIDGCKLVAVRPQTNPSHFRKGTWTFVCSHGIVMNDIDESHFHPDYVGKSNVPIQRLKRTKSRGSAGNALLEFWLRCEYVSGVVAWNNNHQTRGEGLLWAEKRLVLNWWLNKLSHSFPIWTKSPPKCPCYAINKTQIAND